MYSLDTMAHLNTLAEAKAQLRKEPLRRINHFDDVKRSPDYSQVKISLLENAAGVNLIETYFVDSSGCGSESEPALTYSAFKLIVNRLLAIANKRGDVLYSALTGVGQFQVYVSIFMNGENTHAYN
jgi:hypothetical protein